jgi:hypothetical protein
MTTPGEHLAKFSITPWLRRCALMLVMLGGGGLAGQTTRIDDFRCPESYTTDPERAAALKTFIKKYGREHPQATIGDLLGERHRLLVAHGCGTALVSIEAHRKGAEIAPQLVMPDTRNLALVGHKFQRVDEYYDGATKVWTVTFVDDPQHPENYSNQLILNFYDWTPKPTAEAVASALSEERRGTKNIFLFKAPDEPSGEMVYHILSLSRRRANFLNIMSVIAWENSAVNIALGHRLGSGADTERTETEARQWLLSAEGEALREMTARVRVGDGWREYLKQVK